MGWNPSDIAHQGHRYCVVARNMNTYPGIPEIRVDRVQNEDATFRANLEKFEELGTVAPVGAAQDPTEYPITVEENLHNSEFELLLAGKNPASDTAYNIADLLAQNNSSVFVLMRNSSGSLVDEYVQHGSTVTEIQWTFAVGQVITSRVSLLGKDGRWYTTGSGTGLVHSSWPEGDSVSPGGIKGKDARIFFESSGSNNRAYRLQRFTIRATLPNTVINELGDREIVGVLTDPADVTCDFELLQADQQPHNVWATWNADGYLTWKDLNTRDVFIRVYDPDKAEGSTVLKSFKLENMRPGDGTPIRSQVRGQGTIRYTLSNIKETTVNSGGLRVFAGDIA